jgi:hypothetical protein
MPGLCSLASLDLVFVDNPRPDLHPRTSLHLVLLVAQTPQARVYLFPAPVHPHHKTRKSLMGRIIGHPLTEDTYYCATLNRLGPLFPAPDRPCGVVGWEGVLWPPPIRVPSLLPNPYFPLVSLCHSIAIVLALTSPVSDWLWLDINRGCCPIGVYWESVWILCGQSWFHVCPVVCNRFRTGCGAT